MQLNGWNIEVPIPVALAAVATIGYLISRWRRMAEDGTSLRSRRELKRAQTVAADGVTLETIALFVRFWLTSTPALPEQSSPAARAKGAERYDRFVEALGRRLSSGSTVLKEVSIESPEVASAGHVQGQAGSS